MKAINFTHFSNNLHSFITVFSAGSLKMYVDSPYLKFTAKILKSNDTYSRMPPSISHAFQVSYAGCITDNQCTIGYRDCNLLTAAKLTET